MADQGTDARSARRRSCSASQEGRYLWHVNQALRRLFQAPEKIRKCEQCGERSVRATRRATARRPVHQVQSEGRRWKTPRRRLFWTTAGASSWPIWSPSSCRIPAGATSAGPVIGDFVQAAPGLQQVRGVRAVSGRRDLLALDLLRARHRRAVRAALDGDLGAAGRPVPAARVGARVRRGGRQRDRPDSQRPGRRGLRRRGIGGARWPTFNVADSAITVGAIALAVSSGSKAGPRSERRRPGGGSTDGRRHVLRRHPETERLDRFLADQLALSRTVAARIIADKRVTRDGRPLRASVQLERGAW